jgi:murein DD-endopeptidase MepM/ murein hydrolase activator NlpD
MLPPAPPKSRFLEYLLANNQPYLAGFRKWVFLPGMLFNSTEQWWGDKKPRAAPHEGLDLCCFEDADGEIRRFAGSIRIPAAFAGRIQKIDDDFLGKSIFVSHEIFDGKKGQLYTIYGHTEPVAGKLYGSVAEGEIIGVIADRPGRNSTLLPHLHITVAWVPVRYPLEQLTWQHFGTDKRITLLDPLLIL